MIWRARCTCSALDVASRPGPAQSESSRPTRMLPPIAADIAATGSWCRPAPSTDQTYDFAEQPVRRALHVHDVLGMRADAAEQAEHGLNEQRRLDDARVQEVRQVVEMRGVVALELEPRPGCG